MTKKEVAMLDYLEFNLIGFVESLTPHIKDDVDIELIYKEAYKLHKDIKMTIAQPSGLPTEAK